MRRAGAVHAQSIRIEPGRVRVGHRAVFRRAWRNFQPISRNRRRHFRRQIRRGEQRHALHRQGHGGAVGACRRPHSEIPWLGSRVFKREGVQCVGRGSRDIRLETDAYTAFRERVPTESVGFVIRFLFGGSMATVNPTPIQPKTTTAEDTLQRKSRDASVISGGHLVAKALKNEGVDTIFTLCGGHIIDIYDGCVDEGIRIVDVRHEQVAAHAADGYARQTGKLGCVVTTAGPGFTNALTGIATAFRSESPVLHIGGQGALTQHKMGSLQDLPHVDVISPITKFAATVPSTERVADMISMAVREAFNGAPGPVYLEIPRDILDREVDIAKAVLPQPGKYRASTRSIGDP